VVQGNPLTVGAAGSNISAAQSHGLPAPLTVQMAVVVLAILPVIFMFPFAQRYFTKGTLIGAVKG
jgi:putative aldouronate transport system permease protein